jgi:hypothetical protein
LSIKVWTVFFTEIASAELIEAQDWYEERLLGLGRRFRAEIDKAVARVARKSGAISHRFQECSADSRKEVSLFALFHGREGIRLSNRLLSQQT